MAIEGTVINGQIVLDDGVKLPEGGRVEVELKAASPADSPSEEVLALRAMLLSHAGKAKTLPPDMAAQHDHYLHGRPKR